jgi:hypothetical protein
VPVPTDQPTEDPVPTEEPEPTEDPVISKHTQNLPDKTIVTYTHESGKTTREVRTYTGTLKEEGL